MRNLSSHLDELLLKRSQDLLEDRPVTSGAQPWLSPPAVWYSGSGPYTEICGLMRKSLRPVREPVAMSFELAQWPKSEDKETTERVFRMRNLRLAKPIVEKLASVEWSVPTPKKLSLTTEQVIQVMAEYGLKGKGERKSVWHVQPPRGQASMGVNVTFDGEFLTGSKGARLPGMEERDQDWARPTKGVWPVLQDEAQQMEEYCQQRQFTFAELKEPDKARQVCRDLQVFYTIAVRVDGNWQNPRLIFVGGGRMYPLGMAYFAGVYEDIRRSPLVATTPAKVSAYLNQGRSLYYLISDFSRYDLTQCAELQWHIFKAIQEVYHLPEEVVSVIAAANMYAPVVRPFLTPGWEKPDYVVQETSGMGRSGSDVFVPPNHIAHMVAADGLQRFLFGYSIPGPKFGDDGITPCEEVVLKRVVNYYQKHWGFKVKADESVITRDSVKMLRRIYTHDGAVMEPVVMSRFHNLLCPKRPDPSASLPEYVAVVLRAQSVPMYEAQDLTGQYDQILHVWNSAAPYEKLMYDEYPDDRSLTQSLLEKDPWAYEEVDELDYLVRQAGRNAGFKGVVNSGDFVSGP